MLPQIPMLPLFHPVLTMIVLSGFHSEYLVRNQLHVFLFHLCHKDALILYLYRLHPQKQNVPHPLSSMFPALLVHQDDSVHLRGEFFLTVIFNRLFKARLIVAILTEKPVKSFNSSSVASGCS